MKNKNLKLLTIFMLLITMIGALLYYKSNAVGVADAASERERYYAGGMPIGIVLSGKGALVVGKLDIVTDDGVKNPADAAGLEMGDLILRLDGREIKSVADIGAVLEGYTEGGLSIVVRRKEKELNLTITPVKDGATAKFKLGIWVRDTAAGVGTVTFIKENGDFAALGHPIADPDTGEIIHTEKGSIFDCSIVGINKGRKGKPGELKGLISKEKEIGTVRLNNKYGIYGKLDTSKLTLQKPMPGATQKEIKVGKAKIITTVLDGQPQEYDIEIVKKCSQKTPCDRSMVIRVTDKRLLETTGGIVQGMSGSPIIQNGKLCGAVTHVFVNDPTQGYGLYLDWMLEQ